MPKNPIACCLCGALLGRNWFALGAIRANVNGGRAHYSCKRCRNHGDPWALFKHAAEADGSCKRTPVELTVALSASSTINNQPSTNQ
jgi:hypothetical protein